MAPLCDHSPVQATWSPARSGTEKRTLVVLLVAGLLVASAVVTGERAAQVGYPWLEAAPAPAPDIVYSPTYSPVGSRSTVMTISGLGGPAVEIEMRSVLATGADLRVWQTTRSGAAPGDAVGPFIDDTVLVGAAATWRLAHTADGQSNLLYTRIGRTLVVIIGRLGPEELLRIGDSLRPTRASSLVL